MFGDGAYDIIGFVAFHFKTGDIQSIGRFAYTWELYYQLFGHFLTSRLVLFVHLVTERRRLGIENNGHVFGLFIADDFHQGVHEAESGRCILAFGIKQGVAYKSKIGPVKDRRAVD